MDEPEPSGICDVLRTEQCTNQMYCIINPLYAAELEDRYCAWTETGVKV